MDVAEAIADLKRQLAALEATVAPAPQTETLFPDAEPKNTAETGSTVGFLETFTADGSGYPEVFAAIRAAFPAATTMDVVVAISELHDDWYRNRS